MKTIIEHPKLGKIEREDIAIREILANERSFAYGCIKQFTSAKRPNVRKKVSEPEVCKDYLDDRILIVSLLADNDRVIWKIQCNEAEADLYKKLEDEKFVDMFRLFYADEAVTPEMFFGVMDIARELNGGDNITVVYACNACGREFSSRNQYMHHIRTTGHSDGFTKLFTKF